MSSGSDPSTWGRYLDTATRSNTERVMAYKAPTVTALTILSHADPGRVGEMAWLDQLEGDGEQELSRLLPGFADRVGGRQRPLADPRLSRRPVRLGRMGGTYSIHLADSRLKLEVNGEAVSGLRPVTEEELDRGVVLLLGERVALCWHRAQPTANVPADLGLIGRSSAMVQLRRDILNVADLKIPVLIRGESGSGKELVARAIHDHGVRRSAVYSSMNLGAVPPGLAAAELFGAEKGAYSGAQHSRPGYFRRCDGGTLFLDEVGEASLDVQAMLLRALESGEIQPLGAAKTLQVDVRVIAATDADLERDAEEERFKTPLLHRLQGFELHLPPLRRRVEDLGRLFYHFLHQALDSIGESERSVPGNLFESSYVPARLVASLALQPWPGNVRQLRNVVTQSVIASRGCPNLQAPAGLSPPAQQVVELSPTDPEDGDDSEVSPIENAPKAPYRDPGSVQDGEVRDALRRHHWNLLRAAQALGISRTSLYELIERSPILRTAGELNADEISASLETSNGDLPAAARTLEVSCQGLKRRMKELGLSRGPTN